MKRSIRERLTYANLMATGAVFIALGGTSYALTLPRDSVGSAQLREDSVGKSEVRRNAIGSAEITGRSIRLSDVTMSARRSLRGEAGPQGPPGLTFFASIDSAGGRAEGNAVGSSSVEFGSRLIAFSRSVADCVATATITSIPGGPNPVPPGNAHVTVQPNGDGRLLVKTWKADGTAEQFPFNLVVAC